MLIDILVRRTPYHSCKVVCTTSSGDTPHFVVQQVLPVNGHVPNCGDLIEGTVVFSSKRAVRRSVLSRMRESPEGLLKRAALLPNTAKRLRDRLKVADLKAKFVLDELVVFHGPEEIVVPREEWTWLIDPNEGIA